MKASIKTISEMTGFSQATISNVLNNKKGVKKSTAEAVLRAAREIGYLNANRIDNIFLVMYKKTGEVLTETPLITALLDGVESEAKLNGYPTVISNLKEGEADFEVKRSDLLNRRNSGVILLATEMEWEDMRCFEPLRDRLVVVDAWFREGQFDTVLMNNTDSFYTLVDYLYRMGHRDIGMIESRVEIRNFRYRRRGFLNAAEDLHLELKPYSFVRVGPTMASAYQEMKEYLAGKPQLPTAFCAVNDIVAFGAMKALKEAGYRIPEDVSIVGFDNMPFCEMTSPPLTTIDIKKREMGEVAVRRLLAKLECPGDPPVKSQLLTALCERKSVRRL